MPEKRITSNLNAEVYPYRARSIPKPSLDIEKVRAPPQLVRSDKPKSKRQTQKSNKGVQEQSTERWYLRHMNPQSNPTEQRAENAGIPKYTREVDP